MKTHCQITKYVCIANLPLHALCVDVNVLFLPARKRVDVGAGSLQLLDDLVLGFLVSSGLVLVDET